MFVFASLNFHYGVHKLLHTCYICFRMCRSFYSLSQREQNKALLSLWWSIVWCAETKRQVSDNTHTPSVRPLDY